MSNFLSRYIPKRLRRSRVVIPVVKLNGVIAATRRGLSLENVGPSLEKAFAKPKTKAVALAINSPGGSPVQSALIHDRIRQLAAKNDTKVLVFCEDVAASGGYWLATAGDEIYANPSSIVGSIGVIAAGFGFVKAIDKLGIERRVYTAGKNKSILDPFKPEKKADIDRLKSLHLEIHEGFIDQVKSRRGDRLVEDDDMFTGAFWTGGKARDLGLIDGLGNMHDILAEKFGPDVELKLFDRSSGLLDKLGLSTRLNIAEGLGDELIDGFETRALWQRYGL
ncbi:MAG TPA: S49 family peptidase [Rhizobiales bacterium]|nr:S49 family peptidase [Hyphomicrobiales bacterium]